MIIIKMAFRNIFRQRRRSILTALMMTGGFALFSFSVGMSEGMYGNIIDMFTRDHTGHVQIHAAGYLDRPSLYKTINTLDRLAQDIRSVDHVVGLTARVYGPALAFAGKKTNGTQVIGIDPQREPQTTRIKPKIAQGNFFSDSKNGQIILGAGLAEVLKVDLGEEVALISQAADGSVANEMFTITGIMGKDSNAFDRMNCYLPLSAAQQFLSLGDRVHEIVVLLDDQHYARQAAAAITRVINDPELVAAPWQEVEKAFYRAMQVDLKGNYITQFIIMLIVAIGVLNTVLMSILERTREFGVIRAMGTRPAAVFSLIVMETSFLCLMALALGAFFSLGLIYYFSMHGIKLPTAFTYGGMTWDTMTARLSAKAFWQPALVTFLTAVMVSLFPALRAARIKPTAAMSKA